MKRIEKLLDDTMDGGRLAAASSRKKSRSAAERSSVRPPAAAAEAGVGGVEVESEKTSEPDSSSGSVSGCCEGVCANACTACACACGASRSRVAETSMSDAGVVVVAAVTVAAVGVIGYTSCVARAGSGTGDRGAIDAAIEATTGESRARCEEDSPVSMRMADREDTATDCAALGDELDTAPSSLPCTVSVVRVSSCCSVARVAGGESDGASESVSGVKARSRSASSSERAAGVASEGKGMASGVRSEPEVTREECDEEDDEEAPWREEAVVRGAADGASGASDGVAALILRARLGVGNCTEYPKRDSPCVGCASALTKRSLRRARGALLLLLLLLDASSESSVETGSCATDMSEYSSTGETGAIHIASGTMTMRRSRQSSSATSCAGLRNVGNELKNVGSAPSVIV